MATFINEENIAVFAHDLDNQGSLDMIPYLVFIGNGDFYDAVISICSMDSIRAPCKYFLKTMIKVEG